MINLADEVICDFIYDSIVPFRESLAQVTVGRSGFVYCKLPEENFEGKMGFINHQGNLVIDLKSLLTDKTY